VVAPRSTAATSRRRASNGKFRLGCLYTVGQGVPEDHGPACVGSASRAEPGDADAQPNLGGMYAEGLGVAADQVEAHVWFELAASGSAPGAGRSLKGRPPAVRTVPQARVGDRRPDAIACA
jgi:uncharacterized protein